MGCETCGVEVADVAVYCFACAESLARCARCGAQHAPHFSYCVECGARLRDTDTASRALAADSAGGRVRQLTLMFCDLVGSTELSMRLDPEELRAHVRAYRAHCAAVIRRHDGEVAQFQGDGIIACFGRSDPRGGDADRAVRAGLDLLAELPALNSTLAQPILIRIGIHTGAVAIEDRELFGAAPNIAARIQAAAGPNQAAISEQTRSLLQTSFQCEPLAPQAMDGAMPRIYLVRGASS